MDNFHQQTIRTGFEVVSLFLKIRQLVMTLIKTYYYVSETEQAHNARADLIYIHLALLPVNDI